MTRPLAMQYRWTWRWHRLAWRVRCWPMWEWNWVAIGVYLGVLAWIVWLVGRVGEWIVK